MRFGCCLFWLSTDDDVVVVFLLTVPSPVPVPPPAFAMNTTVAKATNWWGKFVKV